MEQGWVFNQVAVEDRMAGLNIGSTDEQVSGGGYEAEEDDDYRTSTELGQIKIVFHRIKQYGVEENPKLKDYSGSREAIAKLDDNISHLVRFGEIKLYNHVQVDVDILEMKPWATRKSANFHDDDNDEYIDDSKHNGDEIYGRDYQTRSKTKNS